MQNIIEITKAEEALNFKRSQKLSFYCESCKTLSSKTSDALRKLPRLLCKKCLQKEKILQIYGSIENWKKHLKEQADKTKEERYGTANYCNVVKIKQTKKLRYGDENYNNNQKREQTCLKRYEQTYYNNREAYFKTCMERYGVRSINQLESKKIKARNTCKKKYGVNWYMQSTEAARHRKSREFFDGLWFDSKPELNFYKEMKEKGITLKRTPISLEYEYAGIVHKCFPDFGYLENDTWYLFEIKGKHFLKKDGTWCNPFNHAEDGLYEAKHQCLERNRVKIIYY